MAVDPRWSGRLGGLAVVLALGAILLATSLSPAFAWGDNALSDLGVAWTDAGTPLTVLVFNGGLVAAGLAGLGFAWSLWRASGGAGRVVPASLGVAVVLLGLVGLFPRGSSLHVPVAVGFYLFVSVTAWVDGVVCLRGDRVRAGVVGLLSGTANAGAWAVWAATGPVMRGGLALPEVAGAVAFAAWVVGVARLSRPGGPRP
jgi:hypothetical membrane protein